MNKLTITPEQSAMLTSARRRVGQTLNAVEKHRGTYSPPADATLEREAYQSWRAEHARLGQEFLKASRLLQQVKEAIAQARQAVKETASQR